MFGYNYRYTMNPEKGTIKLNPTAGTYAKTFGPTALFLGGTLALSAYFNWKEKRELSKIEEGLIPMD